MTTTPMVPSSPPAAHGAAQFLSPTQTPRFAKAAQALPAQPRTKPARSFPMFAADRGPSAFVFAIPFAATAITLVLSARALLDFAQRASEDTPALVQRLEQDALPNGKWKFQKL